MSELAVNFQEFRNWFLNADFGYLFNQPPLYARWFI